MSYLEQRQSHTQINSYNLNQKFGSKVAHKRTEYNNVLWPEIVVENWTGSSGHERHLPTGVGILS